MATTKEPQANVHSKVFRSVAEFENEYFPASLESQSETVSSRPAGAELADQILARVTQRGLRPRSRASAI